MRIIFVFLFSVLLTHELSASPARSFSEALVPSGTITRDQRTGLRAMQQFLTNARDGNLGQPDDNDTWQKFSATVGVINIDAFIAAEPRGGALPGLFTKAQELAGAWNKAHEDVLRDRAAVDQAAKQAAEAARLQAEADKKAAQASAQALTTQNTNLQQTTQATLQNIGALAALGQTNGGGLGFGTGGGFGPGPGAGTGGGTGTGGAGSNATPVSPEDNVRALLRNILTLPPLTTTALVGEIRALLGLVNTDRKNFYDGLKTPSALTLIAYRGDPGLSVANLDEYGRMVEELYAFIESHTEVVERFIQFLEVSGTNLQPTDKMASNELIKALKDVFGGTKIVGPDSNLFDKPRQYLFDFLDRDVSSVLTGIIEKFQNKDSDSFDPLSSIARGVENASQISADIDSAEQPTAHDTASVAETETLKEHRRIAHAFYTFIRRLENLLLEKGNQKVPTTLPFSNPDASESDEDWSTDASPLFGSDNTFGVLNEDIHSMIADIMHKKFFEDYSEYYKKTIEAGEIVDNSTLFIKFSSAYIKDRINTYKELRDSCAKNSSSGIFDGTNRFVTNLTKSKFYQGMHPEPVRIFMKKSQNRLQETVKALESLIPSKLNSHLLTVMETGNSPVYADKQKEKDASDMREIEKIKRLEEYKLLREGISDELRQAYDNLFEIRGFTKRLGEVTSVYSAVRSLHDATQKAITWWNTDETKALQEDINAMADRSPLYSDAITRGWNQWMSFIEEVTEKSKESMYFLTVDPDKRASLFGANVSAFLSIFRDLLRDREGNFIPVPSQVATIELTHNALNKTIHDIIMNRTKDDRAEMGLINENGLLDEEPLISPWGTTWGTTGMGPDIPIGFKPLNREETQ